MNIPKIIYRDVPAGIAPGILEINRLQGAKGPAGPAGVQGPSGVPSSVGAVPYWSVYYYANNTMGTVLLDGEYFINDKALVPVGITVQSRKEYVSGPGGSYLFAAGDTLHVFWRQLSVVNTTGSDVGFLVDVEAYDDTIVVLNEFGTNLTGTIAATGTTITGTGTAFTVDYSVGSYIRVVETGDLWRITAITSDTLMTMASSLTTPVAAGKHHRLALNVFSSTSHNIQANSAHTVTVKANQTHILHILGNNNDLAGYWQVAVNAFEQAGLTWGGPVPASGGTVTSVALTMPAEFSVAGSPINSAGTLAVTKATQSANQVYAGPSSGGAAAPTFRALTAADVPASPLTTKGDVFGHSTVDARIPIGTDGQVLTADSVQTLGLKWATPASGGTVTLPLEILLFDPGTAPFSWTVPTTLTEFNSSKFHRSKGDLSNVTQARISITEDTDQSPVGPSVSIAIQYSTDQTTWNYLDGVSGPKLSPIYGAGVTVSAWVTLTAGAKADVFLRIVGLSSSPVAISFGRISVEFK